MTRDLKLGWAKPSENQICPDAHVGYNLKQVAVSPAFLHQPSFPQLPIFLHLLGAGGGGDGDDDTTDGRTDGRTSLDLDPVEVAPVACLFTAKTEEQESQMDASDGT